MKPVTTVILLTLTQIIASAQDTAHLTEQYVPAAEMSAVLNNVKGVVLSRDEYETLRSKAAIGNQQTQSVFDRIQVNQVNYTVQPAQQQASVELKIEARKFTDTWQSMLIPTGNLNLEEVTVNEKPALVSAVNDGNAVRVFIKEQGLLNLRFRFSTALASIGANQVAAFSTLKNLAQTFSVAAIKGRELKLNELDVQSKTEDGDDTTYVFPYSGSQIQLSWSGGQSSDERRQLVFVSSSARIQLSDNDLRWKSQSKVSVFGKSINSIAIQVPTQLEVTQVVSTGLEGWKLEDADGGNGTRLLLNYRQPFQADRLIDINAVMPLQADRPSQIPTVEFLNVTAHSGQLRLSHERQLRLETQTSDGIRHVGTETLEGSNEPSEVFAFWQQNYNLSAAVRKRSREVFVVADHGLNVSQRTATLTTDLTIETLNEPLFEIQIPVPKPWTLNQVSDAESRPLTFKTLGQENYVISSDTPIEAGSLWKLSVTLQTDLKNPDTPQTLQLPAIVPEQSMLADGQYLITAPEDLSVTPVELRSLASADTGLKYQIQSQDFGGKIQIERRQPLISTRSEIRTWMDQRQTTIVANLTVDVTGGTVGELKVTLPEKSTSDPRFHVQSIAQVPGFEQQIPSGIAISQQTIDTIDNRRIARLVLDRRFSGALTLVTKIQEPRSEQDSLLAAPVFQVDGANREAGLISFEASPEQSFSIPELTLDQDQVAPVDSALVSAASGTGRRRAFVCQFVNTNYNFQLTETRFDTAGVPAAVVTVADYESVISHDGSMQRSCLATIATAGLQTLRFRLPEEDSVYLWSTMLNGSPIEVRSDEEGYFVSLPVKADGIHQLKIVFGSQTDTTILGQVEQRPVQFLTGTTVDSLTDIDVLQQNLSIRYPNSSALVQHHGPFSSATGIPSVGWLDTFAENFRIPDSATLTARSWIAALIVLPLFVLATLLIRRRWWIFAGCVAGGLLLFAVLILSQTAEYAMVTSAVAEKVDRSSGSYSFDAVEEEAADDSAPFVRETSPEPPAAPAFGSRQLQFQAPGSQQPDATQLQRNNESRQEFPPMAGQAYGGGVSSGGRDLGRVSGGFGGGGGMGGGGMGGLSIQSQTEAPAPQMDFKNSEIRLTTPDEFDSNALGRSGGARLSVTTSVVAPDDFTVHRFSSVDSTNTTPLNITIQPQLRLTALRFSVAGLVLLLAIRLRRSRLASKIWLATLVTVIAVASVPLVPNLWQVIPDGLLIGSAASVLFWIVFGIPSCCCRCWTCVKSCGCWTLFQRKTTAAMLMWLAMSSLQIHADEPQQAADLHNKVFIPYEAGKPQLLADKVFVPESQFWKLYRSAYPQNQQRPQVDSAVAAAFYTSGPLTELTESTGSQTIQARFVLQTFDANQTIQLPLGRVAILSSSLDQQPALLLPTEKREKRPVAKQRSGQQKPGGDSAWKILVEEPGQHLLDLEFSVPVTRQNSLGSLTLPIRKVAAGSLTFELPENEMEAIVNGRSDQFRRSGNQIFVPINRSSEIKIHWRPASERFSDTTTLHSQTNTWVRVSDQGLHSEISLSINPRQGEVAEVDVRLPKDWVIRTVSGPTVAAWNVNDARGSLAVSLREPQSSPIAIQIALYKKQIFADQQDQVSLPIIAIPQASRDTGQVLVTAGTEFEIRVRSLSGVSQMNPADVRMENTDGRRVFACRYTRQPAEVTLTAFRTAQRLTVSSFNAVRLEGHRQLWTTQLTARASAAPLRQFDIRIPDDFQVLSVEGNHLSDWYVQQINEQSFLTVQLESARIGTLNFVVNGRRPQASSSLARLTALSIPAAQTSNTWVSVWPEPGTQISSINASEWKKPRTGESRPGVFTKLMPKPPELILKSTQASPSDIEVQLADSKGTLLAESVIVSNVTDTAIEITLALNWQVTNNACRQVSVVLPTEIADRISFKADGLSRQQRQRKDNTTVITFHLQQPATEQIFVMGTAAIPHTEQRTISAIAPEFQILPDDNNELLNQSHFWVLVNQSSAVLEAAADAETTTEVTPAEIRTSLPDGFLQQSVAIQRLQTGQPAAAWQMKFPRQQKVSPAIITLAEHKTVLTETGQWRSHHKLQVRNESRQFLPVRLPKDARFLLCQIDGIPVRIASSPDPDQPEETLYRIPMPQRGQLSAPLVVEFALAGQLAIPVNSLSGQDLQIPQPVFPEFRDSPDFGVTVVRNTWSVYIPETWSARLNSNPRITNVTVAEEIDFEDAELMAAAESLQQIVKSLSNSKDALNGGTEIIMELERQKMQLNGKFGNRENVESFRNRVLMETNEAIANNQPLVIQQVPTNGIAPELNLNGNLSSQNWYLESRELQRNDYNSTNQLQLFMDNAGSGIRIDESKKFQFVLPSDQSKETEVEQLTRELSESGNESKQRKLKRKQSSPAKPKSATPRFNKSQLLDAFQENQKGISTREIFSGRQRQQQMQSRQSGQNSIPTPSSGIMLQNSDFEQAEGFAFEMNGRGSRDFSGSTGTNLQVPNQSNLLSLNFQIPTSGVRHDFVRSGGNANLSMTVRPEAAVTLAKGAAWAFGILLAGLFVLRGLGSSPVSGIARLLLIGSVFGFFGCLFLTAPASVIASCVAIVCAVLLALLQIARSFVPS